MRQEFKYKGRTIVVATRKLGRGWQWTFQIDAGPPRDGPDRPVGHEEIMLQEGVRQAQWEIDRMPTG
jgi:hypothetical protein